MSRKVSSASNQSSVVFMKSSRRSSDVDEKCMEDSYVKTIPPTSSIEKKKTVTICTLCGRYKGIRMRRQLFIILCIAIALLIILLGTIIIFYAIIPAVVRSTIVKAQLSFRSVNIEQIENDRFRLRAQLELSRTGSIAATILPPLIINVDNVGTVRNDQPIPITGSSTGSTLVPIDSPFVVSDSAAFQSFTRSLIFEPQVEWHLTAKASVQPIFNLMPIYSDIPFYKEVTIDALNSLQNVNIKTISLRRSDSQRIFADFIIEILNPSAFSIDLGELKFSLRYNNLSIGYVESTSSNTTLRPGSNAIPFSGELQSTSSESYNALSTVIQNFLTGQTSKVEALAGPDATSYPLLAVGMNGLSLNVQMPPFNEQLIVSLIFNSMSLVPSTSDKTVLISASIAIQINSPLGHQSPLNIETLDMNVSLRYEGDSVGILTISKVPVIRLNSTTYESQFNNTYLILSETGVTYEKFTQNFISANKSHPVDFHIVGVASIAGSFALGDLSADGIPISNDVSLIGLDGLNNVHVDGISVDGEEENALRFLLMQLLKIQV